MRPFIFILIPLFVLNLYDSSDAKVLKSADIKRIYSGIEDIKGNFIQKTFIKDLNRTDTYKGIFFIKLPSRMKWQYSDEKGETEVIIKGQEMILYQKNQRQALRQMFDTHLYGHIPVAFLAGLGNIEDDFNIKERGGHLILIPKRSMGGIVSIVLRPSMGEFPIGSVVITDKRNNRIEIDLKDVSINTGISASIFEFSPPEGVNLQELR